MKLKRTKFNCHKCGSKNITTTAVSQRKVRGQAMGECRGKF